MYNSLKNSLTRLIPKKLLFRIEPIYENAMQYSKKEANTNVSFVILKLQIGYNYQITIYYVQIVEALLEIDVCGN